MLVDWDFEGQCADPTVETPVRRSAQEVIDARFSRSEYNNWHNYHSQDREGVKFSSFEVWNQHGSQPAGAAPSPEEIHLSRLDDEARALRDAVIGLYPLMPNRMTVERDKAGRLYYEYQRTWDEPTGRFETVTLAARDVLHIPGLGFDGLVGYSPIAMAKNTLGLR